MLYHRRGLFGNPKPALAPVDLCGRVLTSKTALHRTSERMEMARIDDIKAKLRAREGQHGFEDNVKAIKAMFAREEARETVRQKYKDQENA